MNYQLTIATMPSTLSSYFNNDLRLSTDKADKIGCGGRDMNNVTLYKVQCEQGEKAQSELGIHVGWIVPLLVRQ